jgi:hypothetical protein
MGYHISLRDSETQLIEVERGIRSKEFRSSKSEMVGSSSEDIRLKGEFEVK